jgi:hypothetical protein
VLSFIRTFLTSFNELEGYVLRGFSGFVGIKWKGKDEGGIGTCLHGSSKECPEGEGGVLTAV